MSMFFWRRPDPAQELEKLIQAAVAADNAGEYAKALDLYAEGIDKMMSQAQRASCSY